MKKYIQRQETRYFNNEFENMPSIDFRGTNPPHLTKETKQRIDWGKVKEICDKHGFRYCVINRTFGGDYSTFVVYLKTDITPEYYNERMKAFNNSQKDKEMFFAMGKRYEPTFKKLHECVHELDEDTDLLFDCSWSGNCGIFGSHDVKRLTYSFGYALITWDYIKDRWSPLINDTLSKLSKGTYVLLSTLYIKPQIQKSPLLFVNER